MIEVERKVSGRILHMIHGQTCVEKLVLGPSHIVNLLCFLLCGQISILTGKFCGYFPTVYVSFSGINLIFTLCLSACTSASFDELAIFCATCLKSFSVHYYAPHVFTGWPMRFSRNVWRTSQQSWRTLIKISSITSIRVNLNKYLTIST